jgi:hypothetical protein
MQLSQPKYRCSYAARDLCKKVARQRRIEAAKKSGNINYTSGFHWCLDRRGGETYFAWRWSCDGDEAWIFGVYCRAVDDWIFVADDDVAGGFVGCGGVLCGVGVVGAGDGEVRLAAVRMQ